MQLSESASARLRDYLFAGQPLGPVDSAQITDTAVSKLLFDPANLLYERMSRRPTVVIGRKGSGKTAFLNSASLSQDYDIVINIRSQDVFVKVVEKINRLARKRSIVLVEHVAEIWHQVIYTTISARITKQSDGPEILGRYIQRLAVDAESDDGILVKILSILAKHSNDSVSLISTALLDIFDSGDIDRLKNIVNKYCEQNKKRIIVLIDTLEDYHIKESKMAQSLAGLLKCIGEFNIKRGHPELRICLPVEIFNELSDISSNRLKDFNSRLLLHWHGSELACLLARRIQLYIYLYYNNTPNNLMNFDPSVKSEALNFLCSIFPDKVTNAFGTDEEPIAYVLRHTQLLPRQIIRIMNEVLAACISAGRSPWNITETDIVDGVKNVEADLWREVCTGFQHRYKNSKILCSALIPELPMVFFEGELHEIFNRTKGTHKHSDYHAAKHILAEIGALGLVTGESDRYTEGTFEYTLPGSLPLPGHARYCIHPMFRNGVGFLTAINGKAIYPYGANPEQPDHRDLS